MKERKKLFSISIKDCRVDTFCAGGKGGSHQNATQSGVRVTHEPSGAVVESRETRSQHENKRLAFTRLANHPKMRQWIRHEAARILCERNAVAESLEVVVAAQVERDMQPDNLKIEVGDGKGGWLCL